METWKQIYFEPGYSISEFGKVRNDKTGLILKSWVINSGYSQLQIRKNVYSVHRLVAMVFHSLSERLGDCVLHLDDDKLNNHYLNLKWATQSENIRLAYSHGLMSKKGEKHHLAKFTYSQINHIRARIKKGAGVCEIAREFGVCHQTISNIKLKKSWI